MIYYNDIIKTGSKQVLFLITVLFGITEWERTLFIFYILTRLIFGTFADIKFGYFNLSDVNMFVSNYNIFGMDESF